MKMKNLFALLLSLVMILSLGVQTFAADYQEGKLTYTAIGDSIPNGGNADSPVSLVDNSYSDLLASYFATKAPKVDYQLKATPHITTTTLLSDIKNSNPNTQGTLAYDIKKSDVITLCIGGGNLEAAINQLMMSGGQDVSGFFQQVQVFQNDFPKIMESIRQINPNATVAVMTIYEPFSAFKDTPELGGFYSICEYALAGVNGAIKDQSLVSKYNYKVADAYQAFAASSNPVALTNGIYFDPHPTVLGHQVLFETHKAVLEPIFKK